MRKGRMWRGGEGAEKPAAEVTVTRVVAEMKDTMTPHLSNGKSTTPEDCLISTRK